MSLSQCRLLLECPALCLASSCIWFPLYFKTVLHLATPITFLSLDQTHVKLSTVYYQVECVSSEPLLDDLFLLIHINHLLFAFQRVGIFLFIE